MHTSTCAGREMSHTMRLPSRYHNRVHAAVCSHLSLPVSVGCRVCTGRRPPPSPPCTTAALAVMGLVLADGCFCESSVTQSQWQLRMCLNRHTCIFLALGATVNNLAKNMDECLYSFKYHHQATRQPNVFAAVECFFCMCFIREIMSLGWSLKVRAIKERRCLWATIILWVISVSC